MKTDEPVATRRRDYQPSPWLIDHVRLTFDLDPQATMVHSELTMYRNPQTVSVDRDLPAPGLYLDGNGCDLRSLQVDGRELAPSEFHCDEHSLCIPALPDRCTLSIVSLVDPQANTALEGLYLSSGSFCTQCEAEGFRRITWYLDRPDVLATFDVTISADADRYPVMLSNGNLVTRQLLADGRHRVHWHDPHPKPCYLFALVAGRLSCIEDTFITASGRVVRLQIFVQPHNVARCEFAMRSLQAAMRWDETVYGLEYDLDRFMIVAVDDFNMGAMENKGLNIFNSRYVLADPQSATDSDFLGIESVIAHEYFHNWTGNRITCRDWFQLSLKEGLTVFRDQCFSADRHSAVVKRIKDVRLLRSRQFAEDCGPLAHPIRPDSYREINNFYTLTVYEKGAEVIRMLYVMLGAERWRQAMDVYIRRHDGRATTCDAFVDAVQSVTDLDLSVFRRWYDIAGTPELHVREHHDAQTGCLELTLSQHCPDTPGQRDKPPLHIPIVMGLLDRQGRPLQLTAEQPSTQLLPGGVENTDESPGLLLHLNSRQQTFRFEGIDESPVVSLLRGFSAPVRVDHAQGDATLAFLISHDSDAFNRWDAAQGLATRAILGQLEKTPRASATLEELQGAWQSLLDDDDMEAAMKAEMLRLPSHESLEGELSQVDHQALADAIASVAATLAGKFLNSLQELVTTSRRDDSNPFDATAIGCRSLANAALSLLTYLPQAHWHWLAEQQYDRAGNMNDRLAALAALCHTDGDARERVLADFHASARGNRLVVDKWFAVQAMSRRPQVASDVRKLLSHADFDRTSPNRLRSLVGSFAMCNPVGLNAGDGRGYRLVADEVLSLDRRNPQLAARLVSALGHWRRLKPGAGTRLRQELQRIMDNGPLSVDVHELVSKSLE